MGVRIQEYEPAHQSDNRGSQMVTGHNLTEGVKQRNRERKKAFLSTPEGKEWRRNYYRQYRADHPILNLSRTKQNRIINEQAEQIRSPILRQLLGLRSNKGD